MWHTTHFRQQPNFVRGLFESTIVGTKILPFTMNTYLRKMLCDLQNSGSPDKQDQGLVQDPDWDLTHKDDLQVRKCIQQYPGFDNAFRESRGVERRIDYKCKPLFPISTRLFLLLDGDDISKFPLL